MKSFQLKRRTSLILAKPEALSNINAGPQGYYRLATKTRSAVWSPEFRQLLSPGWKLDECAIQWMLATGYYPFGATPVKDVFITYPYPQWEYLSLIKAMKEDKPINMKVFDNIIGDTLAPYLHNCRVSIAASGGVDSTYLLGKALESIPYDMEALTVSFKSYAETPRITCSDLEIPCREIEVTEQRLALNLPTIIEELGIPYDRGSVLLSWVLSREAKEILVVGDSADCLFAPAMNSHIRIASGESSVHDEIWDASLKYYQIRRLFKNHKKIWDDWNLTQSFEDNVYGAMLWDMYSEIPYYYRHRWNQFTLARRGFNTILPYQNLVLFREALAQKGLHKLSRTRKWHLRKLCGEYAGMNRCRKPKKAMKVEWTDYQFLVDKYLDSDKLMEMNIFRDVNFYNEAPRTKYLLSLLCVWWDIVKNV